MSYILGLRCMQLLDATFLIGCFLLTVVILQRDFKNAHLLIRCVISLFALLAFMQAMWLLGFWVPGAAGFPWPRVTLDGALFLSCLTRVAFRAQWTTEKIYGRHEQYREKAVHQRLHSVR